MNTSVILDNLKSQGERITPARKFMISKFVSNKKPQNAVEIIRSFHNKGMNINKSTIYRELQFLLEKGIIDELTITSNERYFEFAHLSHHHHFTCDSCGKLEDVLVDKELKRTEMKLQQEKNIIIKRHSLEFYGLCSNCQ